jgi:hypothetical protein
MSNILFIFNYMELEKIKELTGEIYPKIEKHYG